MALVQIGRYRLITGDTSSTDADIQARLADAQELVEDYLQRPIESGERTETLEVMADGYVYPKAQPVTAAPEGYTLNGWGLYAASLGGWPLAGATTVEVTYTGGWDATSVPYAIARAIALAAKDLLTPASDVPPGVTSMSVGDVSVAYKQPAGTVTPDVAGLLRGYRRRVA